MSLQGPKVSIITPVYNAQDYLCETLNCIQAQTYSNLEIVIIDDGSTDSSGKICDEYAGADPRWKVFHTQNGGVSAARNLGLQQMSGEYCMFIDSDDLVKPKYVEAMVSAAIAENASIVTCGCMLGRKHSPADFYRSNPSGCPPHLNIALSDYRYTSSYQHDVVWAGLYRRSLIDTIRFDLDLHVGEDTFFFAQLLKRAGKLTYLDEAYYYYTQRPDSLANSRYHREQASEITAWERVCELFSDQSEEFQNECKAALGWRCKHNYERAIVFHFQDTVLIDQIYQKVSAMKPYVYRSPLLSLQKKINYRCFLCTPVLFSWLRQLITGV